MILDRIIHFFRFDRQDGEYELLETERGIPDFTAGKQAETPLPEQEDTRKVCRTLAENEERLRLGFRADINPDLILRPFMLGGKIPALLAYLNGMADADQVSDFILREGMRPRCVDQAEGTLAQYAIENVFTMGEAEQSDAWAEVKKAVMEGRTAVFFEGSEQAVLMDTRGFEHRNVTEPQAEKVVRGPQEAFVENLRTNITLLRRILHTEDLVCEMRSAGGDNGIRLAVLYREGVTNITLVEEVKRRLAHVNTRVVIGMGMLEQLTEEHSLSPFPQLLQTERPDRTASLLMQGHVVVLLDGSPFASVMPATLFTLMTSPEDIYMRRTQGTTIRVVRYIGAVISVLVPAFFLALALYHQGLFSTEVLTTVIASRKMVFAPIGAEMIFLLIVFQLIREAGMRVPGNIGQAIGIIGGLILGQAAVAANLASSVVLIVVALTGLGNFCIPDYSTQLAAAFFRITLTIAAWMGGLLGVVCLVTVYMAWMASLKSYGVPFLAPFSPKAHSPKPMIFRGRITMHQQAEDILNTQEEGI
mgnify:FL=1